MEGREPLAHVTLGDVVERPVREPRQDLVAQVGSVDGKRTGFPVPPIAAEHLLRDDREARGQCIGSAAFFRMIRHVKASSNIDGSIVQRLREPPGSATTSSGLGEGPTGAGHPAASPVQGLPLLPSWDSGGFRVDIADRDALYRVMEAEA